MTDSWHDWTVETADPEVGIFGETILHDPCQPDDPRAELIEAEELPTSLVNKGSDAVTVTRSWKCPACGAIVEDVSEEPRSYFEEPRDWWEV